MRSEQPNLGEAYRSRVSLRRDAHVVSFHLFGHVEVNQNAVSGVRAAVWCEKKVVDADVAVKDFFLKKNGTMTYDHCEARSKFPAKTYRKRYRALQKEGEERKEPSRAYSHTC